MHTDEMGGFSQTAEPMENPGFSYGIGTGGEFHVDGTPMRLVTFIAVGVLILIILQRGGFRFHVVG